MSSSVDKSWCCEGCHCSYNSGVGTVLSVLLLRQLLPHERWWKLGRSLLARWPLCCSTSLTLRPTPSFFSTPDCGNGNSSSSSTLTDGVKAQVLNNTLGVNRVPTVRPYSIVQRQQSWPHCIRHQLLRRRPSTVENHKTTMDAAVIIIELVIAVASAAAAAAADGQPARHKDAACNKRSN